MIEPRPRMQAGAKLVLLVGMIVTLACIALAFCLPLPEGIEWISVWTLLIYGVPAAVIPVTVTLILVGRFSSVIDLKCPQCGHTETVSVRG